MGFHSRWGRCYMLCGPKWIRPILVVWASCVRVGGFCKGSLYLGLVGLPQWTQTIPTIQTNLYCAWWLFVGMVEVGWIHSFHPPPPKKNNNGFVSFNPLPFDDVVGSPPSPSYSKWIFQVGRWTHEICGLTLSHISSPSSDHHQPSPFGRVFSRPSLPPTAKNGNQRSRLTN